MARILIAEDSAPLAKAMSLKLAKLGHQIDVFADGRQAIDSLVSGNYDFLILDLMLPSMNGFDVLRELKLHNTMIPTIITSNLSQEIDQEKAEEYHVLHYFVKSSTPISDIVNFVNSQFTNEHTTDPDLGNTA